MYRYSTVDAGCECTLGCAGGCTIAIGCTVGCAYECEGIQHDVDVLQNAHR
jgi:hypothetical protein